MILGNIHEQPVALALDLEDPAARFLVLIPADDGIQLCGVQLDRGARGRAALIAPLRERRLRRLFAVGRLAALRLTFEHELLKKSAREHVVDDVVADLELVVAERLAVGEHDQRQAALRQLEVDRREADSPVTVVPDQPLAPVIGDEPAEAVRQALASVRDEGVQARSCVSFFRNTCRSIAASNLARSATVESRPAAASR